MLGSTGSIGASALDVIRHLGPPYRAIALSAHHQADALVEQVREFHPSAATITGECDRSAISTQLHHLGCETLFGQAGLLELVQRDDVDIVLSAIIGAAGLPAAFAAVEAGKTLLLANKESLVIAGALLMPEARRRNVTILPIDSEHSAIFQAMLAGRRSEVKRVIITASGGPFRSASAAQIATATPAEALKHPTWNMGSKITINSATMFNKAAEIIEAVWLFDLDPSQIVVVIHKESIVHSMVEFIDGSIIAQLSPPDMKTPIQYALTYPDRLPGCSRCIDFSAMFALHFEPPDLVRFPAIEIAYDVARRKGTLGAVMNAANEVAVEWFLSGKIGLGMIARVVAATIRDHSVQAAPTLADLLEADRWARGRAAAIIADAV
ncbi:MAG: 1-deoxy-D-xylulose-5-phosphate reductoisomerase [Burkholderiales bacterium]|nr:1-deoxy-D-xylulose-5-phosphate reductoisomerase [Phycisphaerae bacterium]